MQLFAVPVPVFDENDYRSGGKGVRKELDPGSGSLITLFCRRNQKASLSERSLQKS
jgi:hypothetical protein